jgi:chromosome segregation ATPase
MQELVQIIVKRIQAIEDAYRENLRAVEGIGERLATLEVSIADFRAMADHVIAHEAVLTTMEHQLTEQASTLGAIEEQASTHERQLQIVDRQLGAHRGELNAIDELARSIEERIAAQLDARGEALEQRLTEQAEIFERHLGEVAAQAVTSQQAEDMLARVTWLEQMQAELAQRLTPPEDIGPKLEPILDRLDTIDARFASLSDRVAGLQNLHNDVVHQAEQITELRSSVDDVTGDRLDTIIERLEGLDRLAADVASHAGQLATIRGRQNEAPAPPVVMTPSEPDAALHQRVDALARQVAEIQQSATMLESIRTLLAASDIENAFDEMKERVAKIDAQIATLFTLQRMTSPDGAAEPARPVLTLDQD